MSAEQAVSDVLQMRLTEADAAALAEIGAWYPGLTRAALVRLALVELRRYVVAARRRRDEAAVLAEHMPRHKAAAVPTSQATPAATPARKWTREMDRIKQERRAAGLPALVYEELLAAGEGRAVAVSGSASG